MISYPAVDVTHRLRGCLRPVALSIRVTLTRFQGLCGPSVFPSHGSITRCLPFLLTGSLGQVTPLSRGTMKALRLPVTRYARFAWHSRHATPFALLLRVSLSGLAGSAERPFPRRGIDEPGPLIPALLRGGHWISQLPRVPSCVYALLSDPGVTSTARHGAASVLSPYVCKPGTQRDSLNFEAQ